MNTESQKSVPTRVILPLQEARSEPWYLNFNDPRSPHDAWLARLNFAIEGEEQDEADCAKTLQIVLLGSYHDGTITLTYKNVRTYSCALKKEEVPGMIWRRDNWLEDSAVLFNDLIQHRIKWEQEEWLIEAKEILYDWKAFTS